MLSLIVSALLVLTPSLIEGQGRMQEEWLPDELFNPQLQPRLCGLNSDEPGFVCDPNKILGPHIGKINWVLKDAAYNSTKCPCSNYYCETYPGPLGYHIGVALVKSMKIQTNPDGRKNTPSDQAQLFAYRLENNKWKMGKCEEDIVIFYSQDDKVLSIYGGSTAMEKLTPYYRDLLAYRVGTRFDQGYIVEAINNLLYDLKVVLNCDDPLVHDCGLHQIRNGASAVSFSLGVFVSLLLVTVYSLFKV